MTRKQLKVHQIAARLDGTPIPYDEIFREHIVDLAIRRARPILFWRQFSLTAVNEAAQNLKVRNYGNTDRIEVLPAYKVLAAFHRTGWLGIPRDIRRLIPEMIREVLKAGDK